MVDLASTQREREKIYRFRYQVYVEEMGRSLSKADHKRRLLYDDMDDWGLLLYARVNAEIVGTVRLHLAFKEGFSQELALTLAMDKFQTFRPDGGSPRHLSFASKLMVAPHYRNSQVCHLLNSAYYEHCRQKGVIFNLIGCAPYLVALYERMGYRRYKSNFSVPDYGYMVPLVLVNEDVNYLHKVRSPFYRIARKLDNSPESAEWFAREFPDTSCRYINKQLTDQSSLWDILSHKLGQPPEKAVSLFHGLSDSEAMQCAHAGHVVYCEQGDTIVYPDDMSNEIFIPITGSLAVRKQLANRRQASTLLQPGQAFGEQTFIAHARQKATVTARTDTELLVLPRHGVDRLKLQHPEIAAKLLRNIGLSDAQAYTYA